MTRCNVCIVTLGLFACASEPHVSKAEQAGMQQQGVQLQGVQLQGMQQQGMAMSGFQFSGATLNGAALVNVRVEKGELVAEQNQVTLHAGALLDAHLIAQTHNNANPPVTSTVEYRITAVAQESMTYDPTGTGSTYVYTLQQNVDGSEDWQPACPTDVDGNRIAIPIAAIWNDHGDRVESNTLFTFGCTKGVIAKCYRWGYRPWITGYGDVVSLHQACTRLARADYCGNGTSHTHDGTLINVWDNAPSPGPIQQHGSTPQGMVFEAGWSTSGAVCLSHQRWLIGGLIIAALCPTRLIPPLGVLPTVCDLEGQVLGGGAPRLYNESNLNANLNDL